MLHCCGTNVLFDKKGEEAHVHKLKLTCRYLKLAKKDPSVLFVTVNKMWGDETGMEF